MFGAMIYFCPVGGAGMATPAVAAKSSKFAGRRRFLMTHRNSVRSRACKSGWPFGATSGVAPGPGGVPGAGAVYTGCCAVTTGLVSADGGGTCAVVFLALLQPQTTRAKIISAMEPVNPAWKNAFWPPLILFMTRTLRCRKSSIIMGFNWFKCSPRAAPCNVP